MSVREYFGRFDDLFSISEEPLVQHAFNPSPRFYVMFAAITSIILAICLPLPAFITCGIAMIGLSCLFVMVRFSSGYKSRPSVMWTYLLIGGLAAANMSCVSFYGSIYYSDGTSYKSVYIFFLVCEVIFVLPYIIMTCLIFRKFREIALLQNNSQIPIVIPSNEQQTAATGTQSYPVDIVQSDGAAVIQA